MKNVLFFLAVLWSLQSFVLARAFAGPEPRIPSGASWGMTMEQVQRLPELERDADETRPSSYIIRGASQNEVVVRWRGRAISFYVDNNFGLYAINIEMTPLAIRRTQAAADQELVDLEQCAPIRFAILRKYGAPLGVAATWDTSDISSLAGPYTTAETDPETISRQWPYARSWLLWEGQETRLALGEQSLWYASRVGLAQRERVKREQDREKDRSLDRELERRAQRQQQIEDARAAVSTRARAVETFF